MCVFSSVAAVEEKKGKNKKIVSEDYSAHILGTVHEHTILKYYIVVVVKNYFYL